MRTARVARQDLSGIPCPGGVLERMGDREKGEVSVDGRSDYQATHPGNPEPTGI
jgi:hypothetical protein